MQMRIGRTFQLTISLCVACIVAVATTHAGTVDKKGVVIGEDALTTSAAGVAVGDAAQARSDGVAIGQQASAGGFDPEVRIPGPEAIAIGAQARAEGWRCSAIGARAVAGSVSATAIGRGAYAWGPHMIAIGRGAYMEKVDNSPDLHLQNACGIAGDSLWLGGTMAHKMIDRTGDTYIHETQDGGDGSSRWDVRTHLPRTYTIHGMDAYDARFEQNPERFQADQYDPENPATWTNRTDKDVAGGDLHIAAGRGTGTAQGGSLELQTAPAGAVSQNRKNPLRTGMKIDTDYHTQHATPMLLWDNTARRLKRVYVGPPDSGGPGFRVLVIEN